MTKCCQQYSSINYYFSRQTYFVCLADRAHPVFFWHFLHCWLHTGQVVNCGAGFTAQEITQPMMMKAPHVTCNREYIVPQNSDVNSWFNLDTKLLLVMWRDWCPLANHSLTRHEALAIMSSSSFCTFSLLWGIFQKSSFQQVNGFKIKLCMEVFRSKNHLIQKFTICQY